MQNLTSAVGARLAGPAADGTGRRILDISQDTKDLPRYRRLMPVPVIEFTTDQRFIRRKREVKTMTAMIRLYCRGHRHGRSGALCSDCDALLDYATRRTERCLFGDAKPTCANCVVHCYSAEKREGIRTVMRWAGPRMLFRHPFLSVMHLLDGKRPAPTLPAKETANGKQ
jgi:hypothetical protein